MVEGSGRNSHQLTKFHCPIVGCNRNVMLRFCVSDPRHPEVGKSCR